MMLMLADVTGWLHEQNIPYFITYGTLLGAELWAVLVRSNSIKLFSHLNGGAVRENDILPWTQAGWLVFLP